MICRNKKFIVIAVLAALSVIVLIVGGGCTKTGSTEGSQSETEAGAGAVPERMQPQMHLDKVAEILGIGQQELEDAFAQAQSELMGSGAVAPPTGQMPNGQPPEGSPPEGQPGDMGPPGGGLFLGEDLLARVAEILNIEQQALEDAFAQAWSADGAP